MRNTRKLLCDKHPCKYTCANVDTQTAQSKQSRQHTVTQKNKHSPATVDFDREDVVVIALFNHVDDLCVCGDLSALQTLEAKQRDGGNWKSLQSGEVDFQFKTTGENTTHVSHVMTAFSPLVWSLQNKGCNQVGIPYWLNWGTLLQIRHIHFQSICCFHIGPSWKKEKMLLSFLLLFKYSLSYPLYFFIMHTLLPSPPYIPFYFKGTFPLFPCSSVSCNV